MTRNLISQLLKIKLDVMDVRTKIGMIVVYVPELRNDFYFYIF